MQRARTHHTFVLSYAHRRVADLRRYAAPIGRARVFAPSLRVACRTLIVILAGLIAAVPSSRAQGGLNETLRGDLLEMGRRDQEVREKLIPLAFSADSGPPSQEVMTLIAEQREVDEANLQRLDEIVAEYGWPGKTLVGEEASNVARMLVQHADLERQKRYLPTLKSAASVGEASAWGVAMLEDRIRVRGGQNQLYGSNFERGPDGKCHVTPIDDPSHVDERRHAVGLPPMAEYLREIEEQLGKPCLMEPGK
jgi:hypothetical protein